MSGARGPRLAGRTVLVTGSTGMAASAATAIAAEGGAVFAVSRTAAHLEALAADDPRRPAAAANGTRPTSGARTRSRRRSRRSTRRLGRLDAVYSVAGISARRFGDGPVHEATLEGWETVLAANATSQFLVARAAVRRMLAQAPDAGGSRGSVLLMSSTLATRPVPAALRHPRLRGEQGRDRGPDAGDGRDLRAGRDPGQRDRAVGRRDADEPPGAGRPETVLAYLAAKQPLAAGPLDADAVTAIALALLGDDGRMVTGQVIAVDGGWGVAEGPRANRELHRVAPAHRRAPYRAGECAAGPPRGRIARLPRRRVLSPCSRTATAADPVVVAGVVSDTDGAPAAGVEVVVVVAGTDLVRATTTDAAGAFSVEVEAAVGDTIDIRATGPTSRASPTRRAASPAETPIGGAGVTIESLPLDPVAVGLDHAIESRVCSATAAPDAAAPDPSARPDAAGDGPRLGRRRGDAGGTTVPGRGRARLRAGGDRDGGGVALEVGRPLTALPGSPTAISRRHRDRRHHRVSRRPRSSPRRG